jgi:pyrimidine-specific ribonucleoside hydrolase
MEDPIFVFTDPGIDDALALAMAARSTAPRLIGACGVDGNVPSSLASSNLAGLLSLFRAKDIPVFQSDVNDPIHEYPTDVHGKNGLGNVRILKPRFRKGQNLVNFLKSQGRFQILSLGPLTALAALLQSSPQIASQISRCVIMGGGFDKGNVTPYAEFNIHSSPEAADEVFRSNLKKHLIPLDVTEKVRLYGEDLERIRRSGNTPAIKSIEEMLRFYFSFEKKKNGFFGGYMHDPSAFVAMLHPELFEFRRGKVSVETKGKSRGRTMAKFSRSRQANTWIALGVDEPAVRSVIMEALVEK